MKHLLIFLCTLTQLHAATLWQFTRKVDAGAASSTTVTGVASSLFGLNGSGNLVMLPNSSFIALGGTAGTVTDIGNLTGVVTSTNRATAIADAALSIAKTSGLQTALDAKASLSGATFTGAVDASISLTTPALTIGDQVTFDNSIFTYGGGAAAAHRTALGLVIGTNVQAYDADLTTWAGVTPGTGVTAALAVNIGSAGAPALFNGALGTPTSGTITNLTGTASGATVGNATLAAGLSATALTTVNTITAATATNLVLNAGSSGGQITLGQGTNSNVTLTPNGTGNVTVTGGILSSSSNFFLKNNGASGGLTLQTDGFLRITNSAGGLLAGIQTSAGSWFMGNANGGLFLHDNATTVSGTRDTGLTRISAGLWGFGTGSVGSFAGSWKATNGELVGTLITTPDTRTGAGAVSITTSATKLVTTGGADALTLANGTAEGQIKTIAHTTDGGSAVLTPATGSGFTTVTFTSVGESVTLQWFTGGWVILSIRGAVAA